MLRIGLTGGLGSGKSTVTLYLRELGAETVEADELGRAMMEPGHRVFDEVIDTFGSDILTPNGHLDRAKLASIVFGDKTEKRLHELNAIVHPAVIAAQGNWMRKVFAANPKAIAIVESALIFEVERDARLRGESEGILAYWRRRFNRVIVVTAPDETKIARYAQKLADANPSSLAYEKAATDARARLARQLSDEIKASRADFVLENSGDLANLRVQTEAVWRQLVELNNNLPTSELLE